MNTHAIHGAATQRCFRGVTPRNPNFCRFIPWEGILHKVYLSRSHCTKCTYGINLQRDIKNIPLLAECNGAGVGVKNGWFFGRHIDVKRGKISSHALP